MMFDVHRNILNVNIAYVGRFQLTVVCLVGGASSIKLGVEALLSSVSWAWRGSKH